MIKRLLHIILGQSDQVREIDEYRMLMKREASIGGQLFGAVPAGGVREFFCLDKSTWIWHEEWTDKTGKRLAKTTRYDVRPDVILKAQNNGHYHAVSREEARNFLQAAKLYQKRVLGELYGITI